MADLTSGLTTRIDRSTEPAQLLVESVGWMSPFRVAGVEVGDEIEAVDGTPLDLTVTGSAMSRLVGQYAEAQLYDKLRRQAGEPLRLAVVRHDANGDTRFEATASLAERRDWRNAEGRVLVGPDGPDYLTSDGFVDSWTGWAEAFKRLVDGLLDVRRRSASFDAEAAAADLVDRHAARVAYAVDHYPGAWSAAVKYDYDRALRLLQPSPTVAPAASAPTPAAPAAASSMTPPPSTPA